MKEVRQLFEVLPFEGSKRLYELWKILLGRTSNPDHPCTPVEQIRALLLRLSESWHTYCLIQTEPAVPWTNFGTEQAIGRIKMRAKTVRGYKS